jgi:hypothetical protein
MPRSVDAWLHLDNGRRRPLGITSACFRVDRADFITCFMTPMARPPPDDAREERIHEEIIVDASGPYEQAIGWYYYLEGALRFPFRAECGAARASSPLRRGERVVVTKMAPVEECEREMFVMIRSKRRMLAVPLTQLRPDPHVDEETRTAVDDWQYWIGRGYEF